MKAAPKQVQPFGLCQSKQHQDDAIDNTAADTEYNDRSSDDKHLCRCARNKSLAFELQRRGDHGVCKTGDWNQCSGTCELGNGIIETESGKKSTKKHERDRSCRCCILCAQVKVFEQCNQSLTDATDNSPDKKCFQHVSP